MSEEILRDRNGRRIGTIETRTDRVQIIPDANGRRLGEYNPKDNVTRDANGRRVGEGNFLASFLC